MNRWKALAIGMWTGWALGLTISHMIFAMPPGPFMDLILFSWFVVAVISFFMGMEDR